jgi:hypothetical protein
MLVAPGVSPGFERHSRQQARKAGDRNWIENHMRHEISFAPYGARNLFAARSPGVSPGATNMPPALQAGRALPLRSEKFVDQKTEKDTTRMNKVRIVAAALLAIPLLVFGGSYFIHPFPLPPANGNVGIQLLQLMRVGGLTWAITSSHVVASILLLVRRRFEGRRLKALMSTNSCERNRVGGGVTSAVLPHHRTNGSVYGGS